MPPNALHMIEVATHEPAQAFAVLKGTQTDGAVAAAYVSCHRAAIGSSKGTQQETAAYANPDGWRCWHRHRCCRWRHCRC